jgi:hypothetical protein
MPQIKALVRYLAKLNVIYEVSLHPISESPASRSDDRNIGEGRIRNAAGWRPLNLGLRPTRGTVQRPAWGQLRPPAGMAALQESPHLRHQARFQCTFQYAMAPENSLHPSSGKPMKIFVFLDFNGRPPRGDGPHDLRLYVIVSTPTGVVYGHQCAGHSNEQRNMEGFLIPLGHAELADQLRKFFWKDFKGHCYPGGIKWTPERKAKLADLLSQVECELSREDGAFDVRSPLYLDEQHFDECVEAWVPVHTPYGRGVLVFANCD